MFSLFSDKFEMSHDRCIHAIRKAHENIDVTLKAAENILTQFDVSRKVRVDFLSTVIPHECRTEF